MLSSDVVAALTSVVATAAGPAFTVDELLRELCAADAGTLDVDGAGVTVLEPAGARFIHALPPRIVKIEVLQQVLQQGPCHDAMLTGEMIVLHDIAAARRWPEFAAAAAIAGVRAAVAVPLLARGRAWGTLDVYRNNKSIWTAEQLSVLGLFAGAAASYLVMAADRDSAAAALQAMQSRASHDELTGLPSRGVLFPLLEHALPAAQRHRTAVAVLFIDLDDFKNINDTRGHAAGDQVLIEAGRRLTRALRKGDTIVRLAGDEFVFICQDLPQAVESAATHVQVLGHRLAAALARPMHIAGAPLTVTASIGIGIAIAGAGSTPENLLAAADQAMYSAKQRGRGHLVLSPDYRFGTDIPTPPPPP